MTILIKNAKIIHPKSSFHNTVNDLLVKNGVIEKIASKIEDSKAKVISSDNLHVSIGWLDIGPQCSEPGYEHRETLENLSKTAAAGGYTALAIMPNTNPPIDNKSGIKYILNSTQDHLVDYYPIACVSKENKGEEITEMLDMAHNGAVAYSDGNKSIDSSGLLMRSLEYAKAIKGLIINQPDDKSISNGNSIHEGLVSTSLGLKASPNLSESLTVERDIQLAHYTQSKLLVHQVSTKESVAILNQNEYSDIYSSVSYLNLCKTESAIENFDVNAKVSPPLRSESDKDSLINGITKGTIDIITSNHTPLEEELKKKEFTYADSGAIGLQTVFAGINNFAKKISINKLVSALAINPRKLLGIELPKIEESESANLTIFDPNISWTLDDKSNMSNCKNSPFWNSELKGKVIATINAKKVNINNF